MPDGKENMIHIEAIEDHVSGIKAHLELINARGAQQTLSKETALEDINEFQAGPLGDMKIVYEED